MKLKSYLTVVLLTLNSNTVFGTEELIHKQIVLQTKKEKVWSALTDQNELGKWWNKGVKLDPYIGGQFYEPWGEGQLATGKVIDLKLHKFIKFTWKEKYWNPSENTVCTFFLEEAKEGTVLKVYHSGWESIKDLDRRKELVKGFNKGWDHLLPKLVKDIQNE
jgi:uncharacterized protein YndB with AHSA1/START domain